MSEEVKKKVTVYRPIYKDTSIDRYRIWDNWSSVKYSHVPIPAGTKLVGWEEREVFVNE